MKNPRGLIPRKIAESKHIVIAGHVNPDGDCVGSLVALGLGLSSAGKRVDMILQDEVPERYRSLPGINKIKRKAERIPDMAISVDCNSKEMIGRPFETMKKARYIMEIDHHAFRKEFGNLFLIDIKAPCVGELIYELLVKLKIDITREIAQNLLTSIIVETNSFRLPGVRPLTFSICAKLVKTGVDFHKVSETVYWSKTKETAVLSGMCMSRIKFFKKDRIAWSMIRKREFFRLRGKEEDVDAVANDMLSINSVKIAVFCREKNKKMLRVSLRSKDGINVAPLAYKYGGGGHFDSAGCYIPNNRNSINEFLENINGLLK
jgi:bifunctional oligoribonuclease and PAP phosphatase NrnA